MTDTAQSNQQISSRETWFLAQEWVSTNHKLIRQISSPYFRFMAGETEDLYQEATIVAFKAFVTSRKKRKPEQFTQYFRVIFKTSCMKLASGVQTVHCLEDYFLPPRETHEQIREPEDYEIEQALMAVTMRQREVCLWLLQQPVPASAPDIAKRFKVSCRHAYRLLNASIQKISEASS